MPISSGAQGHVGFGVDTSIRWLPKGGKKLYMPLSFKVNSYLQRYLYCHPETKNRCFDKPSEVLPNTGTKLGPGRSQPLSPKEIFKADEKPVQKNQQEIAPVQAGDGSTVPATSNTFITSVKTTDKNNRYKADVSRSSLCTLL